MASRDVRIWADKDGYIEYSAPEGSPSDLVAGWLTSDVQGSSHWLVELLDAIEQRLSGETDEAYEANGNAWFVLITKDRLEIENKYSEPLTGTVTMDLALTVLRAYWDVFDEPAIEKGKRDFRKYNHREPHLPW